MRTFLTHLLVIALSTTAFTQSAQTTEAVYLADTPLLDGVLDDGCWQKISPLDDFTTTTPVFGTAPKASTEVRLFYGAKALYVGVYCFVGTLLRDDKNIRDGERTGDWFRVSLDTWNDDRLAFDFTVSAAGVQFDSRDGTYDWDAVWQSAIVQHADGWSAEIRIPFTALRFPRKPEQDWGLQLTRFDRASGETSTWSPQDPLVTDRVLQFGKLTGLRDLEQERRRSLALQTGSTIKNFRDAPPKTIGKIGLDGRIGLNASSTLDFTILPVQQYTSSQGDLFLFNPNPLWSDGEEIQPRQFSAEEAGLFSKNPNRIQNPSVHPASFLWRLIPDSGAMFFSQSGASSRVLQSSKLTTRGQGDWRLGVTNTLLSPVKAEVFDLQGFESRKETLQGVSNYNFVTLERILPNNSFVNLSNGTLLAGPGYRSFAPSLNFQLRNRANQYELSGATDWAYDLRNKNDVTLRHGYNIRLARINRRWGWNLAHSDRENTLRAPVFAIILPDLSYTTAGVSFQDFRPRGVLLNRFGDLGFRVNWQESIEQMPIVSLNGNLSGLDKGFRGWGISYFAYPQNRLVRYSTPRKFLDRRVAPTLGGALSFRSDTRKRLGWDARVGAENTIKGEQPRIHTALGTTWVPARQWLLQGRMQTTWTINALRLMDTPGVWIFERRDERRTGLSVIAEWFPRRNWRLWFTPEFVFYSYTDRESLELIAGGALTPSSWPLEAKMLDEGNRFGYSFGFQRFFSQISQLRLQIGHFWVPQPESNIVPSPVYDSYGSDLNIDLSFIWFLNGNR